MQVVLNRLGRALCLRAAEPLLFLVCLGCLAPACLPTVQGQASDDDTTEIGDDDAGELDEPALDDSDFLQVGTFNIDWLADHHGSEYTPRNDVDYGMIRQLIVEYDLDLMAMQEIEGEGALDLLELPEQYAYAVGDTGWSQNPAILYRADRVSVANVREVTLPSYDWPNKAPLLADVRAIDGSLAFTFAVVHFVPFADYDNATERERQVLELHRYLTEDLEFLGNDPPFVDHVVVAGDFNDTFAGIHDHVDSLAAFEHDPVFLFATVYTEFYTELSYQSKIDHVVMTQNLAPAYLNGGQQGACHVIAHDQISPYADYEGGWGGGQNISSHRPVWVFMDVN